MDLGNLSDNVAIALLVLAWYFLLVEVPSKIQPRANIGKWRIWAGGLFMVFVLVGATGEFVPEDGPYYVEPMGMGSVLAKFAMILTVGVMHPYLSLKAYRVCWWAAGLAMFALPFFSGLVFAFQPTGLSQLGIMVFIPSSIVAGFLVVFRGGGKGFQRIDGTVLRERMVAYLCLAGSFLGIACGPGVGMSLRTAYWMLHMPEMNRVAARVFETNRSEVWRGVRVDKHPLGEGGVLFWWGGGFPARHSVLAWMPNDKDLEERLEKIRQHWSVRAFSVDRADDKAKWYYLR
jgi:hypothetical protein